MGEKNGDAICTENKPGEDTLTLFWFELFETTYKMSFVDFNECIPWCQKGTQSNLCTTRLRE
jgi:hypothetical protein